MTRVEVPDDLYEAARAKLDRTGFETVGALITFILQQLLSEETTRLNAEEERILEERLRGLGYL